MYNINRQKSQEVRRNFNIELKNRCSALIALEDETDQDPVECSWNRFKESYAAAAKKTVGFKKKKTKKWLSAETWVRIEARRKAKEKMLNAKSSRQIQRTQQEYKIRDREVKQSARKDKRNFIETLANEAEEAAEKREFGTVYKITKQLCGNNTNHSMPVKDREGKVITTEREQAARWV